MPEPCPVALQQAAAYAASPLVTAMEAPVRHEFAPPMPADPAPGPSLPPRPVAAAAAAAALTINGDFLSPGVQATAEVADLKGFEQRTPANDVGGYEGAASEIGPPPRLQKSPLSVMHHEANVAVGGDAGGAGGGAAVEEMAVAEEVETAAADAVGVEAAGDAASGPSTAGVSDVSGCCCHIYPFY